MVSITELNGTNGSSGVNPDTKDMHDKLREHTATSEYIRELSATQKATDKIKFFGRKQPSTSRNPHEFETIHNPHKFSDQRAQQPGTDNGNIELDSVSLPNNGKMEKLRLSTDKELNCSIEVAKVSLPEIAHLEKLTLSIDKKLNGTILIRDFSPFFNNDSLPSSIQFLIKNKDVKLNAQCSIESGKININDISDMKIRLQPNEKASFRDKLTAACVNGILKLFVLLVKRNFFKFYADEGQLTVKLPLRKRTIALGTMDGFVNKAQMDAKGNISIPSLLESYTGIPLPESELNKETIGALLTVLKT